MYALVVKGAGGGGGGVLRLLGVGGDDGLEVLALSSFLAAVAVRGLRDLLRLVDGSLLDVGAVHHVAPRRKRLLYGWPVRAAGGGGRRGGRGRIEGGAMRSSRVVRTGRAHGWMRCFSTVVGGRLWREARPARAAFVVMRRCT